MMALGFTIDAVEANGGKMSYWRIRMMYNPTGEDFTERAWRENLVGIWFGAWDASALKAVDGHNLNDAAM
jgi:hypothetical protein